MEAPLKLMAHKSLHRLGSYKQYPTRQMLLKSKVKMSFCAINFPSFRKAVLCTPLPLFLEFIFHRILFTISMQSISILNKSPKTSYKV